MRSRTHSDLDDIAGDVTALKRDLARLMEHMKNGSHDVAKGSTADAVERLSKEAERLYRALSKQSERPVGAISQSVEEHPLATVLIAFGAGLIGARLLSRS